VRRAESRDIYKCRFSEDQTILNTTMAEMVTDNTTFTCAIPVVKGIVFFDHLS
jgi:hypothetical protein